MQNDPTIEIIQKRRSVRHYSKQPVPRELLEKLVECGQLSPNGGGNMAWHFTVVTDRGVLDKITAANKELMLQSGNERDRELASAPDFDNFRTAPAAVITSVEDSKWSLVDCANATATMAIAAEALGLNSCYIVSFRRAMVAPGGEELVKLLQLPAGWTPQFALCVGYGDHAPNPRHPRRPDSVNWVE